MNEFKIIYALLIIEAYRCPNRLEEVSAIGQPEVFDSGVYYCDMGPENMLVYNKSGSVLYVFKQSVLCVDMTHDCSGEDLINILEGMDAYDVGRVEIKRIGTSPSEFIESCVTAINELMETYKK